MKRIINLSSILIGITMLISCKQAPDSTDAVTSEPQKEAEAGSGSTFKANTNESKIEWIGTKVSGYHSGTIEIKSGELTVSNGSVVSGNFVMDMPTIIATGPKEVNAESNKKLTGHLHSADFFEVNKYPEATFVITGVNEFSSTIEETEANPKEELSKYKITDPTHTISGNLTIKGIEKNIRFPAKITSNDEMVEARAKFNINRKEWGIAYDGQPDDLIRDDIHLGIYLKAEK